MHPAIKIISLIILSLFLTQGNWLTLLLTGAVVLPFYIIRPSLWISARTMIWRLKWLFLSILLIYIFFTPKISASISQLNPYLYLLLPGLFRILVLITLILAVNLFIKTTTKNEILTALLWILSPLKRIKIDIERFILRAVLTIEYLEKLNQKLTEMKAQIKPEIQSGSWVDKKRRAFYHLVTGSTAALRELFAEVSSSTPKEYFIDENDPPGWFQWIIPLILFLLFSVLAQYQL